MSVVSAQSGIAARTGKPFTFQRTRSGTTEEFYPAAGARLHFASCDTDTLSLPGLPVGLLTTGDVVTVQYNGTTVFKGTVATRIERQGRGTDRVEDVTVEGPWGLMARLVFRQEWKVTGSGGTVGENTSHLILNQSSLGVLQNISAQITEIANYASGMISGMSVGTISAGTTQLPPDEARDLTCAAAIMRELRYFPQTICRFDYGTSNGTPALQVSIPPENPSAASYLATIPKTQRSYTRTSHPVVGVDICTQDWDVVTGNNNVDSTMRAFSHQTAGIVNSIDTLHVYMPLAPGNSSTTWESLDVETIDASTYSNINFWIQHHPALAGYSTSGTNKVSFANPGEQNITMSPTGYPRLTNTTVGDLRRFGLNAEAVRMTASFKLETPEKEELVVLTLDWVGTTATTRTYTRQTGSSSTAAETLPEGLAQAILDQRGGELMAEEVTIRLGDSFPTIGDADVVTENNVSQVLYLQNFEVDCYGLTATLHFGRPAFLSPEDMRDLLLGFRQRGFASNVPNRAEPDADDNMEDVGGVQPLKSSSTTISSIAKATIKTDDGGKIVLDSGKVKEGTMSVRKLTLEHEDGTSEEVQYLATSDAKIQHGEKEDSEDDDEGGDEDEYCNDISQDDIDGTGGNEISGGLGGGGGADPQGGNDISKWPCKKDGET